MDYFNIEEELVDYAEVSGFDISSGKYLNGGNLIKKEVEEVKSSLGFFNVLKAFFSKKESVI